MVYDFLGVNLDTASFSPTNTFLLAHGKNKPKNLVLQQTEQVRVMRAPMKRLSNDLLARKLHGKKQYDASVSQASKKKRKIVGSATCRKRKARVQLHRHANRCVNINLEYFTIAQI